MTFFTCLLGLLREATKRQDDPKRWMIIVACVGGAVVPSVKLTHLATASL